MEFSNGPSPSSYTHGGDFWTADGKRYRRCPDHLLSASNMSGGWLPPISEAAVGPFNVVTAGTTGDGITWNSDDLNGSSTIIAEGDVFSSDDTILTVETPDKIATRNDIYVGIWPHVKIDDEILRVVGVSGNDLTVLRGQRGTVAVGHADGQSVQKERKWRVCLRQFSESTFAAEIELSNTESAIQFDFTTTEATLNPGDGVTLKLPLFSSIEADGPATGVAKIEGTCGTGVFLPSLQVANAGSITAEFTFILESGTVLPGQSCSVVASQGGK